MSYGGSIRALFRLVAVYVDKIPPSLLLRRSGDRVTTLIPAPIDVLARTA